jgi:hypothetical protein
MTAGRAALISLIDHYALPWYRVTLLEIQKLAYFLPAAGEPLKLDFVKGKYVPYAENLHHVLQRIEGHFIRDYGDRRRAASIQLLSGAREEATGFLASNSDTQSRLERVSALIEGFETPHSMELLATVHWLANEDPAAKTDPNGRRRGCPGVERAQGARIQRRTCSDSVAVAQREGLDISCPTNNPERTRRMASVGTKILKFVAGCFSLLVIAKFT